MRRFWEFRSNLKSLEYYHDYTDLKTFKKHCHDYYMLFPLWLLENDYFDEVTIWRLTDQKRKDIVFDVNGKKYIQRWVYNFTHCLRSPRPDVTFFRGGFQEYDFLTGGHSNYFGLKLYLGAGQRVFSKWHGVYDLYLIEDERDFIDKKECIPFYKTASPSIFKPLNLKPKWDICWPCNFTQFRYKGQRYFMKKIKENKELQKLKIVHCGNKPEVGIKMAKELGVTNIEFLGPVGRPIINELLNKSKFGLCLSNTKDGCPRVSTEILMSGTPLFLRDKTRLLKYYRNEKDSVIDLTEKNMAKKIIDCIKNYDLHRKSTLKNVDGNLSFDKICELNINLWKKYEQVD